MKIRDLTEDEVEFEVMEMFDCDEDGNDNE